MNSEWIVELGWERIGIGVPHHFVFRAPGFDYHEMMAWETEEDDGIFCECMIKCIPEKVKSRGWKNGEVNFYGQVKTPKELSLVMQFLGIIKYEGI